jgi:NAD-dependent dihydropyrimidine dehydrogenase PreA subunit
MLVSKCAGFLNMVANAGPVVNIERCQGCSNCVMACPINQELDKRIIDGESPRTDDVVLRVKNGSCRVLNNKLCMQKSFVCKRCEEICPRGAIKVIEKVS